MDSATPPIDDAAADGHLLTNRSASLDLLGHQINEPSDKVRRPAAGAKRISLASARSAKPVAGLYSLDKSQEAESLQLISPMHIKSSEFSNRLASDWTAPAYKQLKDSIQAEKGNFTPILVRPVESSEQFLFEVVYGHRRFRACLELALPVLAAVRSVADAEVIRLMETENEKRTNASHFGRGQCFNRAMMAGIFQTHAELAEAVNLDKSTVAKYIRMVELPPTIIDAFPDPARIHLNWASRLQEAWKKDEAGVRQTCEEIRDGGPPSNAKEIFKLLTRSLDEAPSAAPGRTVYLPNEEYWSMSVRIPDVRKREAIGVSINPGVIDPDVLIAALRDLLRLADQANLYAEPDTEAGK